MQQVLIRTKSVRLRQRVAAAVALLAKRVTSTKSNAVVLYGQVPHDEYLALVKIADGLRDLAFAKRRARDRSV